MLPQSELQKYGSGLRVFVIWTLHMVQLQQSNRWSVNVTTKCLAFLLCDRQADDMSSISVFGNNNKFYKI